MLPSDRISAEHLYQTTRRNPSSSPPIRILRQGSTGCPSIISDHTGMPSLSLCPPRRSRSRHPLSGLPPSRVSSTVDPPSPMSHPIPVIPNLPDQQAPSPKPSPTVWPTTIFPGAVIPSIAPAPIGPSSMPLTISFLPRSINLPSTSSPASNNSRADHPNFPKPPFTITPSRSISSDSFPSPPSASHHRISPPPSR